MVYAYFYLPFRKFFKEKEKMIRVVGKVIKEEKMIPKHIYMAKPEEAEAKKVFIEHIQIDIPEGVELEQLIETLTDISKMNKKLYVSILTDINFREVKE